MSTRNLGHPSGSWYAATAHALPALARLEGKRQAEVCVVGAGYTGLGAALELAGRGVAVIVLEGATVGSGASGRNGGQVHPGQRREQAWLEEVLGRDDAKALWRMAQDARSNLSDLISRYGIE